MDLKFLLQALNGIWLMEEVSAYKYGDFMLDMLEGKIDFKNLSSSQIKAGLFDEGERPYRANANSKKTDNGEVLVIPVSGPMMKNDFCGDAGTASLAKMIAAANTQSSISSIVMKWDTPGGTVDGTENFANAIAQSRKPVVSYVEMACSAGYWAASGSDKIVLNGQTGMVGSIGTMATLRDYSKSEERNGSRTIQVFATRSVHKNKAAKDVLEGKPETYINEILNPLNTAFENAVTANRTGKIDPKNEDVCTGKVYFGNDAIRFGLADSIGSLETAIKMSLQLAKTLN